MAMMCPFTGAIVLHNVMNVIAKSIGFTPPPLPPRANKTSEPLSSASSLSSFSKQQVLKSFEQRSETSNPPLLGKHVATNTPTTVSAPNQGTSGGEKKIDPSPTTIEPQRTTFLSVVMQPDSSDSNLCSAGDVLKMIDLAAAMAAKSHAKDAASVVTLSYDRADFQIPVFAGDLLSLDAEIVRIGRTSMTVLVIAKKRELHTRKDFNNIFRSLLTFVAIDSRGKPTPVPKLPQLYQHQYAEMAPKAETRKVLHQQLDKLEADVVAKIKDGQIGWDFLEEPWNKIVGERLTSEATTLVYRHMFMPKNQNIVGSVFGGDIVEWMEECARHCARHFTKSDRMKTVSMHRQYFLEKVLPGDLVECTTRVVYTGKHTVHVFAGVNCYTALGGGKPKQSHVGHFVLVNYDRTWRKQELSTGLDLSSCEAGSQPVTDYAVAQVRQKFLRSNWNEMLLL